MNKLKFNSQVCTTQKQSRKLLALGLKSTTADCHYTRLTVDSFATTPTIMPPNLGDLPAWSLHRLLLLCDVTTMFTRDILETAYDDLINVIETLIKNGYFNKE